MNATELAQKPDKSAMTPMTYSQAYVFHLWRKQRRLGDTQGL